MTSLDDHLPTATGEPERPAKGRLPVVVLLVDDQAIIAEAIRRALAQDADISFHYCGDARQAVASARSIRPTVILQDLVLPGIDGLTLVKAYRGEPELADTPIIVLSTREEASTKSAAFSNGANDYLVKVPDTIELVARLRYHSRLYHAMRDRDEAYRALRASEQRLQEANRVLQRINQSDGLTGLANRRYFDEYLSVEWDKAKASRRECALLMIDVDHFKTFNDTQGHLAGDEALKKVAQAIRSGCTGTLDLPARYGGEEFAAVLPGLTLGGARLAAERIRLAVLALNVPHPASTTAPMLTVSMGVASLVPRQHDDPDALIARADGCLYEAKRSGRNRACA